jgi:hypothetical protein
MNLITGKGSLGAGPSQCSTASSPSHTSFRDGEDYCNPTDGEVLCCAKVPSRVSLKNTCWPGMVHGLASLAGVLDAGKVFIDRTGAALRKAFE